jgi:hypothetical protein
MSEAERKHWINEALNWHKQPPFTKVVIEDWQFLGYPDKTSWEDAYNKGREVYFNYYNNRPPAHTCAEYFGMSYGDYKNLSEFYKTNGCAQQFVPHITEYVEQMLVFSNDRSCPTLYKPRTTDPAPPKTARTTRLKATKHKIQTRPPTPHQKNLQMALWILHNPTKIV